MSTSTTKLQLLLLIALVIAAAIGIRFSNLDADPPSWYIPDDQGFHVDEGYKTFAAKNLLLYGQSNWNPEDDYKGWLKLSPITQYSYYAAFKTLGLELASARVASIAYYGLFLIIFSYVAITQWGGGVALLGAVMLTLDPTLFNFSRVALFESTLILFIYTGLFSLLYLNGNRPLIGSLILALTALVAGFFVKMSALLYLTPAIGALIVSGVIGNTKLRRRHFILIALFVAAFALTLYLSRSAWIWRVALLDVFQTPQLLLWNHIAILSPFLMTTAYLCIIHTIADRPSILSENLYRLALVAIVVVTPLMLAMFSYNPPRYYSPIIPAAILLILDWVSRRDHQVRARPASQLNPAQIIAIIALSLMIVMQLLRVFDMCVILPLDSSEEPGISKKAMMLWLFPPAAAAILGAGFILRKHITDTGMRLSIKISLGAYLVLSLGLTGRALLFPTYDANSVLTRLQESIETGQSVAGGWAPFLAASAPIPSMYMNMVWNHPDRVEIVRPDHFIFSNIPNDKLTLAELKKNPNITLEHPIDLGSYYRKNILLYPIRYPQH